jgi:hypothetical protein
VLILLNGDPDWLAGSEGYRIPFANTKDATVITVGNRLLVREFFPQRNLNHALGFLTATPTPYERGQFAAQYDPSHGAIR